MKKNRMDKRSDAKESHVTAFAKGEFSITLLPEKTLVAEDERLADHLDCTLWSRWSSGPRPGEAWPSEGPWDAATLRLPKGKKAIEMAFHALGSVLSKGGSLYVYGANDEGIKSTPKMLEKLFDEVTTVSTRMKCRLIQARGPKVGILKRSLAEWAEHHELLLDDQTHPWTTYPGLFAKGGVDDATALLLQDLEVEGSVLEFGCGTGVLAAGLFNRGADSVTALDADALAVEATRINVPKASVFLGDGWHAVDGLGPWDAIISNPPVHKGVSEDYSILKSLIDEAPKKAHTLILVVQRQIPVQRWLEAKFKTVTCLQQSTRFHVWQGSTAKPIP